MKKRRLFILFILPILLVSCHVDERFMDVVSDKTISIIRYDRLQNEYIRSNSLTALQRMNMQYSHPTRILIEDILAIGQVSDDNINQKLLAFYSDTTLIRLMEDAEKKYADVSQLEKELGKGFRRLKKEIPTLEIPQIYAQISALNESIVVTDSLIGISLDKYMGQDYPLYNRYYYEYQRRSMRPDRVAPDLFNSYLVGYYPIPDTSRRTLLDMIIHFGKINYVVQQILDYSTSEDIMGYSDEEKKWCSENKKKLWEYLLKGEQLYTTDPMLIRRYIRPAPYFAFFGENSPGRIGTWIGTEIVASYMKRNKKTSMLELLTMTNYELLFNQSGFNP